jgi:hypothetical protein
MNDRDRLEQLRGLLDRLERMPASADRDFMLSEVRARAVDVETGVRPAAVRALPQEQANADITFEATTPRKPVARPRKPRRAAPEPPRARPAVPASQPPAVVRSDPKGAVDLLEEGGLLCLGEPPAEDGTRSRPWSVGLRG